MGQKPLTGKIIPDFGSWSPWFQFHSDDEEDRQLFRLERGLKFEIQQMDAKHQDKNPIGVGPPGSYLPQLHSAHDYGDDESPESPSPDQSEHSSEAEEEEDESSSEAASLIDIPSP